MPPRGKQPLIPRSIVSSFKECFVHREVIRTIDEFFSDFDFGYEQSGYDTEVEAGHGQRRSTAAGYIASLDLSSAQDVDKLVKAIAYKLREWEQDADPAYRKDLERLIRNLDNAGFSWDGRSLNHSAGPFAEGGRRERLEATGIAGIADEMSRIDASINSDPADAITAARALLETTCKAVLEELNQPFNDRDDLPDLYKKAAKALQLDPIQHQVVYRQTLQGLVSAVHGLAEVRNKLGDAHGKGRAAVRPQPRHARMAAGAAATVATFLTETLEERRRGSV